MYNWIFCVTYYGLELKYKIKAKDKSSAIEKGYEKARKETKENNCAFNFKYCNLI